MGTWKSVWIGFTRVFSLSEWWQSTFALIELRIITDNGHDDLTRQHPATGESIR